MNTTQTHTNNPQLQKFATQFDCTHFKFLPQGLEIRVSNLDSGKHDAEKFIQRHGLDLQVVNEGNMVAQRAFLVKPI